MVFAAIRHGVRSKRGVQNVALSLSGGGHLLPYHLGVCQTLLNASNKQNFPRIQAVSGSSSGAIAAVVATRAPDHIQDYAYQFIQDRGNALKNLQTCLSMNENEKDFESPQFFICTTKCRDGSLHLFDARLLKEESELLECVRASCTIPRSFHPQDVLASVGGIVYPDSDGILIGGEYHVDGGIAGPAPPVPDFDGPVIVVSPISGSPSKGSFRISPKDTSFAIWKQLKCRRDFYVRPSIQNLKALRVASGSTTSSELQSWYEQGLEDANEFLKDWEMKQT